MSSPWCWNLVYLQNYGDFGIFSYKISIYGIPGKIFTYKSNINLWYIYLQNWVIFGVNVGKYSIHGAYGYDSDVGKLREFSVPER